MTFLDAMDWSKVPDNFRCPICKNIITNAVQANDCGCQYCLDCLDQLTKNGSNVNCVKCGVGLESDVNYSKYISITYFLIINLNINRPNFQTET